MTQVLLAAPSSGSGKTTVVCALLAAFQKRGLRVHSFKCGPDYIDPMFHRAVLGVPCHNLDLYLTPEERLKELYARYAEGADAVLTEGVMGYYDGVGGTTTVASAWHVADVLDLPVVLVVRPKGSCLTLAAELRGLTQVPGSSNPSHLAGILLNDCTPMLYKTLKPVLEQETGLPVFGFLPHLPEATIDSRHLGLQTAGEIPDLTEKLNFLVQAAEDSIDLNALQALGGALPAVPAPKVPTEAKVRIAVAKDAAFNFCYEETLDAFRDEGAEPVFFSPLEDQGLPGNIGGLYLPGGYPELYADQLSQNESMLQAVNHAVLAGLPTIAECGGFLYLHQTLENEKGDAFPMADVLPGRGEKTKKLVRFGYLELTSPKDNLLAPAGTPIRTHNFHYWESTERGNAFHGVKPVSGRAFDTGFATKTLYAAFPHLYFAGNELLTRSFVTAARVYDGDNHE